MFVCLDLMDYPEYYAAEMVGIKRRLIFSWNLSVHELEVVFIFRPELKTVFMPCAWLESKSNLDFARCDLFEK